MIARPDYGEEWRRRRQQQAEKLKQIRRDVRRGLADERQKQRPGRTPTLDRGGQYLMFG